jgi:hypothetical protein
VDLVRREAFQRFIEAGREVPTEDLHALTTIARKLRAKESIDAAKDEQSAVGE